MFDDFAQCPQSFDMSADFQAAGSPSQVLKKETPPRREALNSPILRAFAPLGANPRMTLPKQKKYGG
jgi:hypothetical protein